MTYKIERKRNGVVKNFSGAVTCAEVLKAEQEVVAHPDYMTLRYIISNYIGTEYIGLTDSQTDDRPVLSIGGHVSNPRIKYAFVIQNPVIRELIKSAVASGEMVHKTQIFDTYEQAAAWVGL
jgi:hypothetical protein